MIAAGTVFLGVYFATQNGNQKFMALERPSYYILQNYWYFFLSGIAVLFFSILGSFFSWLRSMEEREAILPNAGYLKQEDITKWVGGTSLDTMQVEEVTETVEMDERTVLLGVEERTELLADGERTEVLDVEERTELLVGEAAEEERTELLADGEQTEKGTGVKG